MSFESEFTSKAVKDLKSFQLNIQKLILETIIELESSPFPFKKKIKKIKGIKFPCFRLRLDFSNDTIRIYYGIDKKIIYILRIVSKKDAEKAIKIIKNIKFPPD